MKNEKYFSGEIFTEKKRLTDKIRQLYGASFLKKRLSQNKK